MKKILVFLLSFLSFAVMLGCSTVGVSKKELLRQVDELKRELLEIKTKSNKDGREEAQKGYENGYSIGYQDGYTSGCEDGKTIGYKSGKEDGYNDGLSDGIIENDRAIINKLSFMQDTPESSCFSKVGYFEGNLYVTFRENKRHYIYYDVPKSEWESMMDSESIGSYFNSEIKYNYDYGEIIDGTESVVKYIYIVEYDDEKAWESGYEDGYMDGRSDMHQEAYREGYEDAKEGCSQKY